MSDHEAKVIRLGDKEVKLDPANMKFNEITLNDYMEKEAGWYDYFGSMLAEAEYLMQRIELEHDTLYSERFKEHKEQGCSDKLAEANAKADPDVEKAKLDYLASKHKVRLLQQHLRAWDRAHENAQSRGHFLRKEIDKLNKDIYGKPDNYLERRLDDIIKEVNPNDVQSILGDEQ
jgi:hypothetical protein